MPHSYNARLPRASSAVNEISLTPAHADWRPLHQLELLQACPEFGRGGAYFVATVSVVVGRPTFFLERGEARVAVVVQDERIGKQRSGKTGPEYTFPILPGVPLTILARLCDPHMAESILWPCLLDVDKDAKPC
jgi:hypothetical protein